MRRPEKIDIISNRIKLNAYFYAGMGKGSRPTLIWLHGIPGGFEEGKSELAINLSKAGINVLRFNYQGLWGNEGKFIFTNSIKDLSAVNDFINNKENVKKYKIDTARILFAGYSYGTAVVLAGALYDERIENIICIANCDYSYFGRQFIDPNSKIRQFLDDAVKGVFSNKEIFKQDPSIFLKKLSENTGKYDIVKHAEKLLSRKILMISGIEDNMCPVEDHLLPVYRRLRELGHKYLKMEIRKCGHEPPANLQKIILNRIKDIG